MIEVKAKTGVEMIRVLDEHDRELGIMTFYPSDLNLPARLCIRQLSSTTTGK